MVKRIATITPTEAQGQWLEDEKKRTNESYATIIRKLIQEKIDNETAI